MCDKTCVGCVFYFTALFLNEMIHNSPVYLRKKHYFLLQIFQNEKCRMWIGINLLEFLVWIMRGIAQFVELLND
jgi:hypothetical protein